MFINKKTMLEVNLVLKIAGWLFEKCQKNFN